MDRIFMTILTSPDFNPIALHCDQRDPHLGRGGAGDEARPTPCFWTVPFSILSVAVLAILVSTLQWVYLLHAKTEKRKNKNISLLLWPLNIFWDEDRNQSLFWCPPCNESNWTPHTRSFCCPEITVVIMKWSGLAIAIQAHRWRCSSLASPCYQHPPVSHFTRANSVTVVERYYLCGVSCIVAWYSSLVMFSSHESQQICWDHVTGTLKA